MAQLDVHPTGGQAVAGLTPAVRQHSFVDHEIFSMVILSLLLIQEGQLSVSGKGMCTILVDPIGLTGHQIVFFFRVGKSRPYFNSNDFFL